MEKETDVFFVILEGIFRNFSYRDNKLKIKDNGFWGGGKNIELNNHTIIVQHIRSAIDPGAATYLSFTLYDLRFDENGMAFSRSGIPRRNFDFEEHCLRYQEVELIGRKGQHLFWKDRLNKHLQYSTSQLIHEWFLALVNSIGPSDNPANLTNDIYHPSLTV